jgi:hypothetical protein
MGSLRLTATLVARGAAAAVVLDEEQVAVVGKGAKRFPVVATVNDCTWRTTVTRMHGEFLLGLNRAVHGLFCGSRAIRGCETSGPRWRMG